MGLHAVFVVQCSLEFLHFFSRRTAVEYIVPICRTLICMPRSFPDCILLSFQMLSGRDMLIWNALLFSTIAIFDMVL